MYPFFFLVGKSESIPKIQKGEFLLYLIGKRLSLNKSKNTFKTFCYEFEKILNKKEIPQIHASESNELIKIGS